MSNYDKVSYCPAKYFHNDLDDEDNYYLEIRLDGDNKFVTKDSIDVPLRKKKEEAIRRAEESIVKPGFPVGNDIDFGNSME